MPNPELTRIVDAIAREKKIDREQVCSQIEQVVASGLRKHFNTEDATEFQVQFDRSTGDVYVLRQGKVIPLSSLGRVGAETIRQAMVQLIRPDGSRGIHEEYKDRVGTIVNGTIARFEGGTMIVSLGRVEGIMPQSEQIPGETRQPGERLLALIMEVSDTPGGVKIILSRSHPELICRLFQREVPELGERKIEIKAVARDPGQRTKVAVSSIDSTVDSVSACRGRIEQIVGEIGGEIIDILRWSDSSQIFIGNALKPADVAEVALCFGLGRATVVVNDDQLSLAIGKRGQNIRLAARLTGWDIEILTPPEFQNGVQRVNQALRRIEGITQEMIDKVVATGLIDVRDIAQVGVGPLMKQLGFDEAKATEVVTRCGEEAKIVAAERAPVHVTGEC